MTTEAAIGHGITFKINNESAVLTAIGEITSVTPPGISRDAIDATHSASPDGYREFIGGLKDGGEATAELNFVPGSTGHALLLAQFGADIPSVCEIEFPDGSTFDFSAWLSNYEPETPVEDKMTATVTFKVTGKPTFTAA